MWTGLNAKSPPSTAKMPQETRNGTAAARRDEVRQRILLQYKICFHGEAESRGACRFRSRRRISRFPHFDVECLLISLLFVN